MIIAGVWTVIDWIWIVLLIGGIFYGAARKHARSEAAAMAEMARRMAVSDAARKADLDRERVQREQQAQALEELTETYRRTTAEYERARRLIENEPEPPTDS